MILHTKDQAPKEGKQPSAKPVSKWEPNINDYLQFLIDSKLVYDTFERIIKDNASGDNPALSPFYNNGLERGQQLTNDIQFIIDTYCSSSSSNDGPNAAGTHGEAYAEYLYELGSNIGKDEESLPRFICHYYNHYFAHTAGGRMIGKKMGDLLLSGKTLSFYQWEGDVRTTMGEVKGAIDEMAEGWTDGEREACLDETGNTFRFAGGLLSYMR